tara:strand:+ start:1184 stop:1798 length:615 start_codon:yes stop_codon:yes gene_type:complete
MSGIISQNVGRTSGLVKATEGSGEWTMIKSLTASGSGTLDFVNGTSDVVLDATYDAYCFRFTNIHPSVDDSEFQFNMSADTGSNYNVTKTASAFVSEHTEGDSAAFGYQNTMASGQSTAFQHIAEAVGTDNDQCTSGWLYIFSPASTAFIKCYIGLGQTHSKDSDTRLLEVGGHGNTTSAVDAVRFQFGSGNIDSGTVTLYGIG